MDCGSLSVVMPCLNEAGTLATCIRKIKEALAPYPHLPYEIIVADNGSSDGSIQIAEENGARVVPVSIRGYGAALHAGITAARYEWVLFADADDSYDFREVPVFLQAMDPQTQLIVGNRYSGGIARGAMPFLHRYLGTPVISFLGRRAFKVRLRDFNCGMRAVRKTAYHQLSMRSPGMEYATEMIARAGMQNLGIKEVPVKLQKDGRGRKPHLRTWQDGWKHLRLMLLLSPEWLLLAPALLFLIAGALLGAMLLSSYIKIFNLVLDIHTLFYTSVIVLLSIQLLQFYIIARITGSRSGLYPLRGFAAATVRWLSFEKGLVLGLAVLLLGLFLTGFALYQWKLAGFGPLDPVYIFRIIIPAGFCISLGSSVALFGFLLYTLRQSGN